MDNRNLQEIWAEKYKIVPEQLIKIKDIPAVATGFNANIDAILKISGKNLNTLLSIYNIPASKLKNITQVGFNKPEDVLIGIVKCFSRGIAEEWVTDDKSVYQFMNENLGYDHLQMGGQGGIIANVLALLGIKKVIAHTNSHPNQQAEQFLRLKNLLAFNEKGELDVASKINRKEDIPLIHWIIEFNKGDSFTYEGMEFTCPKSNRFIATYDPLNMNLVMNKGFVEYLNTNKMDYIVLSGFHPLLSLNGGVELIKNAVPVIQKWQKNNPQMITHLEIASTQDKTIRKAILDYIAPLCQSAGLNERETIDLLEITGQNALLERIENETTAPNLFEGLLFLKKHLNIPRIQLHMFGLYITLQDNRFPHSPEDNLKGMMTAAVVSSSKAKLGALEKYEDITATLETPVSKTGLNELKSLAEKLGKPELIETGICDIDGFTLSAVPTILIDNPKTLVGMGDTISSISLISGR